MTHKNNCSIYFSMLFWHQLKYADEISTLNTPEEEIKTKTELEKPGFSPVQINLLLPLCALQNIEIIREYLKMGFEPQDFGTILISQKADLEQTFNILNNHIHLFKNLITYSLFFHDMIEVAAEHNN